MSKVHKLEELLKPTIEYLGYELWGVHQAGAGHSVKLCVYIDSERGITLEDCEKVSRQIGTLLDVEEVFTGSFDLEVSSPGLDRLLFTAEQYRKCTGEDVDCRLYGTVNGSRRLKGTLTSVTGEEVLIQTQEGLQSVPFSQIQRARIVPQFIE